MTRNSKRHVVTRQSSWPFSADERLEELGIKLPAPPEPFGTYVEAVQTGHLPFSDWDAVLADVLFDAANCVASRRVVLPREDA